jgi:hypothetical protein
MPVVQSFLQYENKNYFMAAEFLMHYNFVIPTNSNFACREYVVV